jgi:hypothetical protein
MRIFGQVLLVDKQKVPYLYKAKLKKNSSISSPPEPFKEFPLRGCSYDPTYRDVLPSETNISMRSYGVFRPVCRDEFTM